MRFQSLSLIDCLGIQTKNLAVRLSFCLLFWLCLIQLIVWAFDTKSPLEIGSYTTTSVRRGETAHLVVKVKRNLNRHCYALFSRYLFDSKGYRHGFGVPIETMTPDGVRALEALTPDELRLAVPIPESAAPGVAHYVTELEYRCNPLHYVRPIQLHMDLEIVVLS